MSEGRRGGRQKGTPNKRSVDVLKQFEEAGCNPLKILMDYAMTTDDPAERIQLVKELLPYYAPKRKAIEAEVTADVKSETQAVVITAQELKEYAEFQAAQSKAESD